MAEDFEEWLSNQHISQEAQQAILENITDNPTQEQLIEDENNHIPDVFTNWNGLHDSVVQYRNLSNSEYGTAGTDSSVSNLIAYQSAKETNTAFFDISYVQSDKSGKSQKEVLDALLDDMKTTGSKTLMLGQLEVHKDDGSFNGETFEALLESEKLKAFDTVIMPVALSEKKDGENHRHTVSLILHNGEAMLIDQCGKDPYLEDKKKIKDLLEEKGITLSYESDFIMENRMDCAIFASMINKQAATDLDGLQEYITKFSAKEETEKAAEVDNFNGECKTSIVDTYAKIFANSPLFRAYLKAKGLDFSTLSVDEKMEHLRIFNDCGLSVDEKERDDDRVSDPAWKEEVRRAVKEANEDKNRSAEFKEYPNDEHPDHLFFKDKNNDKNIIAFASKEQAYVEGEQAAFDHLALTAKKLGKDTINFGKFEKHPEYKAMLYLACLKHGLEMKNAPEQEELKQYPEYKEIRNIRKKELLKKLPEIKTKSESDMTSTSMVPATRELFNTFSAARETYGNEANAENKKALVAAREALETQYPELKTNRLSEEETIRELAQIYREELAETRQNYNEKKDQPSQSAYRNTLKEATKFYIENGSGKPNDWSTSYERHQKIKKHTSAKEDGTIERKEKSGKTETLQKFALERQIVQTVLQNRR